MAPLQEPVWGLDPAGVVDLGGQGWALVCVATPVNLSLRTPPEQQALLASFARLLHALAGPMQVLVRSDRADLTLLVTRLRAQAAALPHPELEQAALAHARWLEALTGDQQVRRRQLLVTFHQPTSTTTRPRRFIGRPSKPGLLAGIDWTVSRWLTLYPWLGTVLAELLLQAPAHRFLHALVAVL